MRSKNSALLVSSMAVLKKIKRAVRGEVNFRTVALEAIRRSRASLQERKERAEIQHDEPLALTDTYAQDE